MAQLKNNPIALDNTTKLFGVNNNVPGEVVPGFLGIHNLLHVQDQKNAGVQGGTFTSGAWRTRDLNTVVFNNIVGVSLASNQITVPQGHYFFEALSCVCVVGATMLSALQLYNITATEQIIMGMSGGASCGAADSNGNSKDYVSGYFELTTTSVLELQHRCHASMSTYGFGVSLNATEFAGLKNIYSDLKIWKLA